MFEQHRKSSTEIFQKRTIGHIDMDAFFASVEQRDHPEWQNKPVIVGADPKAGLGRGVVATCSYEARKFGIHSAMPISKAYKRCPNGIFVRGRMSEYVSAAKEIFRILKQSAPLVEPVSIDEAYFDLTGTQKLLGEPEKVALDIKAAIWQSVHLKSSVGIAPTKSLAKIASDHCKPDGLLVLGPKVALNFLWKLPISKLSGVGQQTTQRLKKLNVATIGDVAQYPIELWLDECGQSGLTLYQRAWGYDPRPVSSDRSIKSMSHEHTFDEDTASEDMLLMTIGGLCEKLSRRLRKKGLKGRCIGIKLRQHNFKTWTREMSLDQPIHYVHDIYHSAKILFFKLFQQGMKVRLIGVKVTGLDVREAHETLFSPMKDARREHLHKAVEEIKDRFGEKVIRMMASRPVK